MMLKSLNKNRILSMMLAVASLWIATDANATVNGFYLGGQGGWGNVHQEGLSNSDVTTVINSQVGDFTQTASSSSSSSAGLAGRIFGGYQISQNLAVELGYTRFHNMTASVSESFTDIDTSTTGKVSTDMTLKTQAVDLVAKGIIPFQNGFNIYGKLGAAYLRATGDANVTYTETGAAPIKGKVDASANSIYPTFGAGVGYDLTQNVVADVSWNRIQKVGGNSNLASTDLFAVGLSYHFG